jgi:hypothetical protein
MIKTDLTNQRYFIAGRYGVSQQRFAEVVQQLKSLSGVLILTEDPSIIEVEMNGATRNEVS